MMDGSRRKCEICSAEADWICVRTPNMGYLNSLCDRHFQTLKERNEILAARYDHIAAVSPMEMVTQRTERNSVP
jgi:hypothetical protein